MQPFERGAVPMRLAYNSVRGDYASMPDWADLAQDKARQGKLRLSHHAQVERPLASLAALILLLLSHLTWCKPPVLDLLKFLKKIGGTASKDAEGSDHRQFTASSLTGIFNH